MNKRFAARPRRVMERGRAEHFALRKKRYLCVTNSALQHEIFFDQISRASRAWRHFMRGYNHRLWWRLVQRADPATDANSDSADERERPRATARYGGRTRRGFGHARRATACHDRRRRRVHQCQERFARRQRRSEWRDLLAKFCRNFGRQYGSNCR